MKSLAKYLKNFGIFLISFIVFIEIGCLFYIRYINQSIPLPTYHVVDANNKFWANLDENFGTWHQPNSSYLHNKSCFVVEYHANSLGMRDPERSKTSDEPRAVVLGDSFIEGWGIEIGDRLTDRMELDLGHEMLNFATSGTFGTIQEWQQYKHLVKTYDHDVVILSVLPHNDFKDNDYARAGGKAKERRPYLTGKYPNFKLIYTQDKLYKRPPRDQRLKSFDFTLREWSAFYRVMRYLGSYRVRDFELTPRWVADFNDHADRIKSAYHQFKPEEWDIVKYCIEQIVKEADGRPVVVMSIATEADFEDYDGTKAPLTRNFEKLAKEQGFIYCDMLEEMTKRDLTPEDVFFVCDNHWSPVGNRIAAEILEPYVKKAFEQAKAR